MISLLVSDIKKLKKSSQSIYRDVHDLVRVYQILVFTYIVAKDDYKIYFSDTNFQESSCLTATGATPNKPCIFPFIYEGVTYNHCIWGAQKENFDGDHWCSTKVNKRGTF